MDIFRAVDVHENFITVKHNNNKNTNNDNNNEKLMKLSSSKHNIPL